MPRFICLLLAAALLLTGRSDPAFAAGRNWLRADTHNFIIYSSGNRQQLEEFAAELEKFDALLRLNFGFSAKEQPFRLTIYMLNSQTEVAAMNGDRHSSVAGYYMARRDGSFAVSNREKDAGPGSLDAQVILFHEYAHHVTYHELNFPYPAWFSEGFAEYLATATFERDGTATLGKPANHRAVGLLYGDGMKASTILYGDRSKFSAEKFDEFYGRSWLLVHYLTASGKRPGQLNAYLKALGAGQSPQAAAQAIFGDLRSLDRELDSYLNGKMTFRKTNAPLAYRSAIRITALDPVDSELVLLTARRKTGNKLAEVRDDLARLAARAPDRAAVWHELALAELDLHDEAKDPAAALPAAAEAAVDRALAADPAYPRSNALKAQLAFERLREAGDEDAAKWRAARALLIKANAADPEDPVTLFNWYRSYELQGREPTKVAYAALAKAYELQPEVSEVRAAYAFSLARQGQYEPARALARLMAQDPHNPGAGEGLLEAIDTMTAAVERSKGGAAPAEGPAPAPSSAPSPSPAPAQPAPAG